MQVEVSNPIYFESCPASTACPILNKFLHKCKENESVFDNNIMFLSSNCSDIYPFRLLLSTKEAYFERSATQSTTVV